VAVAPLKKSFIVGDSLRADEGNCHRYLARLSRLEDPRLGRHKLMKSPAQADKGNAVGAGSTSLPHWIIRSGHRPAWRRLLSGWTKPALRNVLGAAGTRTRQSLLRRWREHGLNLPNPQNLQILLTTLGRRALIDALKLREHVILPLRSAI